MMSSRYTNRSNPAGDSLLRSESLPNTPAPSSPPSDKTTEHPAPPQQPEKPSDKSALKTWGTTLGLLGAGWLVSCALERPKSEPPAKAEKSASTRVLRPNDALLARFDTEGDLEPKAYQHLRDGAFNYYIPTRGNPEVMVAVTGVLPGAANDAFCDKLQGKNVELLDGEEWVRERQKKEASATQIHSTVRTVLGLLVVTGLVLYAMRRISRAMSGGPLSMGLADVDGDVIGERPKEGFDHIGGATQTIEEFRHIRDDLRLKQSGRADIELPKGILLYGPPGTGKTMLARALAAETDCPFVSFKGSELTTQFFVGSGIARVREAFEQAREMRDEHTEKLRAESNPEAEGVCIVFIDEFDSVARKRELHSLGTEKEEAKVVNALLAELDNIDKARNRNIIVLAATNDMEVLDPAVIRPGRFNRRIEVPLPESKQARIDILQKLVKHVYEPKGFTIENGMTIDHLARLTVGRSGADLAGILEKATSIAKRENRKLVRYDDLIEGFQQQVVGFKSTLELPPREREVTAQHELIGHGLVAWACGVASFLISMQPRGKTLGRVIVDPEATSEYAPSKRQLLQQLLIDVAGHAAETLRFGELGATTGALEDFEQSRRVLRMLISTGLLDGNLAESLLERRGEPKKLSEQDRATINTAVRAAQDAAAGIINAVPREVLDDMLESALRLDKELIGEEAARFYDPYLGPEIKCEMQKVLEEYLKDPLGKTRTHAEEAA